MELKKLTLADCKKYFAEVLRGYPHAHVYINPNGERACAAGVYCSNVDASDPDNWKPSCIVGHVLFKHGVSLEKLSEGGGDVTMTLRFLLLEGILDVHSNAARYLTAAQLLQDKGAPWRIIYNALGMAERF